ncbi:MAG: hypothetical protein ACKKMP_03660 [Candidatus Nealsonbacteria bacterium]
MTRNKKIAIAGGIILVVAIGVFAFLYQFSAPQKTAEEERIVINLTTTEEELIPKLKEDLVLDSFCYEPESSYEKKLGNLYIVGFA